MIEPLDIVNAARREKGTPFHHQGRATRMGIDCIGLLVMVARELGIPHQDETVYGREPSPEELRKGLEASGLVEIDPSDRQLGDVLVFWIKNRERPRHVGIQTDLYGEGLIHTYADVAKVVEHALDGFWRRRIAWVWRFPGVRVLEVAG